MSSLAGTRKEEAMPILQNPVGHADNRDLFQNLVQTWAKASAKSGPKSTGAR
jgi:hypothetical protein